jgi:hypothetical protein
VTIYDRRLSKEDKILRTIYESNPHKKVVFVLDDLLNEILNCINKEHDHLLNLCLKLGSDVDVYYYSNMYFFENSDDDCYELTLTNYKFNRNVMIDMLDSVKILIKNKKFDHLMKCTMFSLELK